MARSCELSRERNGSLIANILFKPSAADIMRKLFFQLTTTLIPDLTPPSALKFLAISAALTSRSRSVPDERQ